MLQCLCHGRLTIRPCPTRMRSFQEPVALSDALRHFRANISGRSPAKTCLRTAPLFLQCSWCSFASSEILDQKGGSLSQDDRIPEAPVQNSSISGATPGRSLTNDKSFFSTLEMMACLQGAKNGGYLDDRQHAETNRAGSLKPITTDTAAGLLTRRAEGTQLLPPD